MPTKKPAKEIGPNRVWIELEKPRDDEHAGQICAAANRMLERLRGEDPTERFGWDKGRAQYTYGSPMGYMGLKDRGEWFNLDYLGRE